MIKSYEEWLKYYENATKEQIIEDVEHDNLEIERLNNIINELERYINEEYIYDEVGMKIFDASKLQDKLQELKGSNEPSFEEMVGFVESVCKDIKSQPTLHEELEEERKTIAKIVGDFKEVNK